MDVQQEKELLDNVKHISRQLEGLGDALTAILEELEKLNKKATKR